jgi:hypothetical protein
MKCICKHSKKNVYASTSEEFFSPFKEMPSERAKKKVRMHYFSITSMMHARTVAHTNKRSAMHKRQVEKNTDAIEDQRNIGLQDQLEVLTNSTPHIELCFLLRIQCRNMHQNIVYIVYTDNIPAKEK